MRRFLLISLAVLAAVTLVAFFTSPPSLHSQAVLLSLVASVLVISSIALYRALHRHLAAATSLAAVSIAWAIIASINASLASSCPGNTGTLTTSCTPKEIAGQATIALLLPLVPLVVILPLRVILRTYRVLHGAAVAAVTKDDSPHSSLAASTTAPAPARTPRGRTTPKGTVPSPTKKKRHQGRR